jgi:CO/xanthine dehydrogenase Mo-binding subunit
MSGVLSRRTLLEGGGVMVIAAAAMSHRLVPAAAQAVPQRPLDPNRVDTFFVIHQDGSVTLFTGKVDLGTGLRIAIPQMAAEELGIGVDRIRLVEGDTSLTPNQGPTGGSSGVARGGIQIRQAAATAREALIRMGATALGLPASDLEAVNGEVRPKSGGKGIGFGVLIGDKRFSVELNPNAPLKDPNTYTIVAQSLPRPDVPDKATGRHVYVHDLIVPGMVHGRVRRPPAVDATLATVDESSLAAIPGARVVRIRDFLGVVAPDEWDAVRALRALKADWVVAPRLVGHDQVRGWMQTGPFIGDEVLTRRGDAGALIADATNWHSASFYWPVQTHGSIGPSCAVADVSAGNATIWTASQATHRFRPTFAKFLGMTEERVRLIYVDGAGCYGMNGHDDAAADAALLSQAVGMPVRVQWMREDEHGWDPKGPPQLLALQATLGSGYVTAWRTEMWLPKATANLPNVPLLGPQAAGIAQVPGLSTGLISQNAGPPYAVPNVEVLVHWMKDAPLRPSKIRAPGKIANSFAVESFMDELAAASGRDCVEFRLQGLADPRGIEVLKRAAALLGWQPRPSPGPGSRGRGIAYVHYKDNETYVATAMEVEVDRASGEIRVARVACAHNCGLVINPDATRAQIEGNILQTLSRTLHEEVTFDHERVTSLDWSSYPILTFREVPEILIDLVERRSEPPLGVGEAAATPVAAALANAVFDAIGIRIRTVPFTPERVRLAM